LFERNAAGAVLLIAPDRLLVEFAGLVAKRRRRKEISGEQAQAAFRLVAKCAPRLFDMRPQLPRALDLSLVCQLSLWDCVYVVLALEQDCPVLTADRGFSGPGRPDALPCAWFYDDLHRRRDGDSTARAIPSACVNRFALSRRR
jgi:predicted nucleic acid-binding protein